MLERGQARLGELRQLPSVPTRRRRRRTPRRLGRVIAGGLLLVAITGLAGLGASRLRPTPPPLASAAPTPPAEAPDPGLDYVDGVLRDEDEAWAVGTVGDVVTVGDWDCDGNPTLALLRPSTGALYTFIEWATASADVVADRLEVVDGATGLEAADVDGDGCDDLVVERAGSEPVIVHPPDHL